MVGTTPIILIPNHCDDAFSVWLLLVRPVVRHLTGRVAEAPARAWLTRKVASAVGLLDIVPVRRVGPDRVEPLAVGAVPAHVLAIADAVLLVPPAAEGYDAGTEVDLEPL